MGKVFEFWISVRNRDIVAIRFDRWCDHSRTLERILIALECGIQTALYKVLR